MPPREGERDSRNNDGLDALATALAASRNERLAQVDPEGSSEVLRLLSERRYTACAESCGTSDLLPGGVTGKLSAERRLPVVRHQE